MVARDPRAPATAGRWSWEYEPAKPVGGPISEVKRRHPRPVTGHLLRGLVIRKSRGMGPRVKYLLLILETYARNESGLAWPAIEQLADDCEVSYATTKRALKEAIAGGWLAIVPGSPPPPADPRGKVYRILPAGYAELPAPAPRAAKSRKRR